MFVCKYKFLFWGCLAFFACLTFSLPARAVSELWNRPLAWPVRPTRIISLSPATTEILYAVGAGAQIVAVTSACNYPQQAFKKNRLGLFGSVPLEAIIKLNPDLIVVTTDMRKVLSPLQRLSAPVLALESHSVAQIWKNLELVGAMTGHRAQGQAASRHMQAQLQMLTRRIPAQSSAPRVFYMVWDQPLISAGSGSFIGDVLRLSGVKNLAPAAVQAFPHVSLEYLLRQNPDVLMMPESIASRVSVTRAPFERLRAVQQQQVLRLPDDLISRPAPRVVQAMARIIDFLYPRP